MSEHVPPTDGSAGETFPHDAEPGDTERGVATAHHDTGRGVGEHRDPLLTRAERIADLPLDERPAAFDGLNRAVVAELNTLEEG